MMTFMIALASTTLPLNRQKRAKPRIQSRAVEALATLPKAQGERGRETSRPRCKSYFRRMSSGSPNMNDSAAIPPCYQLATLRG